jgi:O-antigen/teichoic acid export membrane protein
VKDCIDKKVETARQNATDQIETARQNAFNTITSNGLIGAIGTGAILGAVIGAVTALVYAAILIRTAWVNLKNEIASGTRGFSRAVMEAFKECTKPSN